MKLRETALPLLAAAAFLAGSPAAGTTITLTGLDGAPGAAGVDGDPGGEGLAGGDGEAKTALVTVPGSDNTAIALGGDGGAGGGGGDGIPAGAQAGNGGAGGNGGDATATAVVDGDVNGTATATATAVGGYGGAGGGGGDASSPGVPGTPGSAGVGGDALAEATVDAELRAAHAIATAGEFSPVVRPGNRSTATANAASSVGDAISESRAYGGGTSSDGDASATSVATATGSTGTPIAGAEAYNNRHGSDATADARATNVGTSYVSVGALAVVESDAATGDATATAYGAGGGMVFVTAESRIRLNRGSGGVPTATAEGHSTGGGTVDVKAIVSRAGTASAPVDIALVDAVSGSTAGLLTLHQEANAEPSGDAINALVATNPGGGALALEIVANGGVGSDTVLGDILGSSTTGAAVSIDVTASAPDGGRLLQENRSAGAPSTPSRIHAESNGGDVKTSVEFGQRDNAGAPMELVDVATGDTTGALTLEQTARAFLGTSFGTFVIPAPGVGGSALSSLTKHTASSELELRAIAQGGITGVDSRTYVGGSAGEATATTDGSNSAGAARVHASAFGGNGFEGAAGGDAAVEAKASTTGDGHEVVIGEEFGQIIFPDTPIAFGGDASCVYTCVSGIPLARGGDARSTSTGTAAGDSAVTVFDGAVGGMGGGYAGGFSVNAVGGDGGDAVSNATADGGGPSTVKAKSDARGGQGGYRVRELGAGGDADATANAAGLGRVEAWARAAGGDSMSASTFGPVPPTPVGPFGRAGSAIAHASAEGASGFARAEALTGLGDAPMLRAQSEALVGSRREVAAAATNGAALASAPADPGLEGSAFVTGKPLAEDVTAALAGNAAFAGTNALALARWTGDAAGGPLSLSTQLEVTMGAANAASRLLLGAFAVSVTGDGFESLSLSLTKNGIAQRSELFDTADEVIAFFAGSLLDLGTGWSVGDNFLARFDLALGAGTRFEMGLGYATAVPEPDTAVLLIVGLLLFTRLRCSRRAD